jgi:hypothetical protein
VQAGTCVYEFANFCFVYGVRSSGLGKCGGGNLCGPNKRHSEYNTYRRCVCDMQGRSSSAKFLIF